MQIFQGVHHRVEADAVLFLVQLRGDLRAGAPLVPQRQRALYQQLQPQGGGQAVDDEDVLLIAAEAARQPGALHRARQRAGEQHRHHLVARFFGLFKDREEQLGAGLAGGGQFFSRCETGVKLLRVQVDAVAVNLVGAEIDVQGHDGDAEGPGLLGGEIRGGIGDDANCHKMIQSFL